MSLPLPFLRAVGVSALCALGVLPAVGQASGGFQCVPSTGGVFDTNPTNPTNPTVPTTLIAPVALTVLHAGDALAPTAALVALEQAVGFVSVPSNVTSSGSVRLGKTFTYAPLDTATDVFVKVRLPGTGPCGRGACDLVSKSRPRT